MFIPFRCVQVCNLQVKSEGYCMQLRRGTVSVSKSIKFALLEPTVGCLCEWLLGWMFFSLKQATEAQGREEYIIDLGL